MNRINILDCTLRDGGYYNNWDFPKELVNEYLKAVSESGIKFVELGFRSLKQNKFKGANFFTTDSYIESLKIPKKIKVGVMVNTSELISNSLECSKSLKILFKEKKKTKLHFVRLATHFDEVDYAIKICKILKKKGYVVGINLMQITEQTKEKIIQTAKKIKIAKPDILYFADSLGAMLPKDIPKYIDYLKVHWQGDLGIHTHNNLGNAINNSIRAMDLGVQWIDSTITGMGRGPGNSETEYLLIEMKNFSQQKYDILPITKIINKYFLKMKLHYKWGVNPYYYLAGKYGIHPTYIQEMLSIKLDEIQILEAINKLKNGEGKKYDVNLVKSEFQKPIPIKKGTWSPSVKMKGREVLIVSSGPKFAEYQKEIEKFIIKKKPFVIAMNTSVKINKRLIDIYVACNPLRLLADSNPYKNIKSPIALPASLLTKKLKKKFNKIKIFNYGIGIQDNKYKFYSNCSYIPRLYNVAYALSLAASGKAKKILLAGFDGYSRQDRRLKIVDELFYLFSSTNNSVPVVAITPTNYNIAKKSVYTL